MIMIIIIDIEEVMDMEKTLKHSKQRDAILNLLKGVYSHPTAEWLYMELKKDFSNISLATVYRNLNLLLEIGEIIKLDVGDGVEHFDANADEHCHFICNKCHKVIDISVPSSSLLKTEAENFNDISVTNCSLFLYGNCSNCK